METGPFGTEDSHFGIKVIGKNEIVGHSDPMWFHWMLSVVGKAADVFVVEINDALLAGH
jgi:hypothetical protein